jgi:hypothetical protein
MPAGGGADSRRKDGETAVLDADVGGTESPASIAADLATVLERFESEVRRLQAKLAAARDALLLSRETGTASILQLRRLNSDDWLERAAEEIASADPGRRRSTVAILRKHRDGAAGR